MADFGLAVVVEESITHELKGTPRWMAPELMDPETFGFTDESLKQLPSKSTDIYAIGMTIFEASICLHPRKCRINLLVGSHWMSPLQRSQKKFDSHAPSYERETAGQTILGLY